MERFCLFGWFCFVFIIQAKGFCRYVMQVKVRHGDWKMLIFVKQMWFRPIKSEKEF